jgi:nitrite reductase (NADH) small subunit
MPEYIRACSKTELPPPGEAREITVAGRVVCFANVNGSISAIDNICLHRGGPIGQGVIEKAKVVCPWHGWQWDPVTGQAAHNPNARVAVYPIKLEGDDVYIQI